MLKRTNQKFSLVHFTSEKVSRYSVLFRGEFNQLLFSSWWYCKVERICFSFENLTFIIISMCFRFRWFLQLYKNFKIMIIVVWLLHSIFFDVAMSLNERNFYFQLDSSENYILSDSLSENSIYFFNFNLVNINSSSVYA